MNSDGGTSASFNCVTRSIRSACCTPPRSDAAATASGIAAHERSSLVSSAWAPVVLISIDTLRADHLPAYGYRSVDTPHLDALRRDAILFRNAYAHCPMTLPSHLSMLTGLLPPQHGVRDNAGFHFDGTQHATLPRLLHEHGYASGAAVSSF